jgi:hypothetical protein
MKTNMYLLVGEHYNMTNQEGHDVMKVIEGEKPIDFEFQNSKGEKFKLSSLLNQKKKNSYLLLSKRFYTWLYHRGRGICERL